MISLDFSTLLLSWPMLFACPCAPAAPLPQGVAGQLSTHLFALIFEYFLFSESSYSQQLCINHSVFTYSRLLSFRFNCLNFSVCDKKSGVISHTSGILPLIMDCAQQVMTVGFRQLWVQDFLALPGSHRERHAVHILMELAWFCNFLHPIVKYCYLQQGPCPSMLWCFTGINGSIQDLSIKSRNIRFSFLFCKI